MISRALVETVCLVALEIIIGNLAGLARVLVLAPALVVVHTKALIRVGAVVLAVEVVLAEGSCVGLVAPALLLGGAEAVLEAVTLTLQLHMTVMFEEGVQTLTPLLTSALTVAVTRTGSVTIQEVEEGVRRTTLG